MQKFIYGFLILVILGSCNDRRVDTKGVKQELEKFKIKRISQGEIISAGEELGVSIADQIQKNINSKLDTALKKGSIKEAMAFCRLEENHLISQLENQYMAKIRRAGYIGRLRNQESTPDTLQSQILGGYLHSKANGLEPSNDVFLQESEIVVNAPIILNSKTCLRCHGAVGTDISKKDYDQILATYPQDKSVNFKLKEPMGVWTVVLDKEEVIRKVK